MEEPGRLQCVVVFGAETPVGQAVVRHLSSVRFGYTGQTSSGIVSEIRAVLPAESSSTAAALAELDGVTTIVATADDAPELDAALAGATELFLDTPRSMDGASAARSVLAAAAAAGVGAVCATSLTVAPLAQPQTTYGALFAEVEAAVRDSGMRWTVLRTTGVLFEAFLRQAPSVAEGGVLYGVAGPDARVTPVAAADVGRVGATVVKDARAFEGRTLTLHCPAAHSMAQLAGEIFSHVGCGGGGSGGRRGSGGAGGVRYEQTPRAAARQALHRGGMPRWEADAELQLWELANEGGEGGKAMDVVAGWNPRKVAAGMVVSDTLMATGVEAASMQEWVAQNADAFRAN